MATSWKDGSTYIINSSARKEIEASLSCGSRPSLAMQHATCKLRDCVSDPRTAASTQSWQRLVRLGKFSRPMRSFGFSKEAREPYRVAGAVEIEKLEMNDVEGSKGLKAEGHQSSWRTAGAKTIIIIGWRTLPLSYPNTE